MHYIVGPAGSGKSHTYAELCKSRGEEAIYMVSDYSAAGGFDLYSGEPILFMDEYKGQLGYDTLLSILDKYKKQLHTRYANIWMLWSEVYITSVYPPEAVYELMVPESRQSMDTLDQLMRRITDITYCWVDEDGYHRHTLPMSKYKNYLALRMDALRTAAIPPLFAQP